MSLMVKSEVVFASKLYLPNIGGVENSINQMAMTLSDSHHVKVITTDLNKVSKEKLDKYERNNDVDIFRAKTGSRLRLLEEIRFHINSISIFKGKVNDKDNSIVIARNYYSVLHAKIAGCKKIAYLVPGVVRNQNRLCNLTSNTGFLVKFKNYISMFVGGVLQNLAFRLSSKVFVFSDNMKVQVCESLGMNDLTSEIKICKPGVNRDRFFKPNMEEKKALREMLDIPLDKIIILGLGRFVKAKGFDGLIETMPKFSDSHFLFLVGSGPELKTYKEIIKKLGIDNVRLIGPTDKPEFYYKASDIFAMTSTYEPLGQTTIEAQACGLPIIYYKCSKNVITATEEIIYSDYSFGVHYGDKPGLVDVITTVTKKLDDNVSRNMANWTINKFSWKSLSVFLLDELI